MVNERTICCCGASSWTRVIAWLQILDTIFCSQRPTENKINANLINFPLGVATFMVGNALLLILTIIGMAAIAGLNNDDAEIEDKGAAMGALAFAFIISLMGIFMGVVLLKGSQQKRVSFLKAWIIYGITSLAVSTVGIFLTAGGSSHSSVVGPAVVSGLLGIGVNLFTLFVVYIHIKEINEGVFIP